MKESKKSRLEASLKKMLKEFNQAEDRRKKPIIQSGVGNVIRRREGKKDKRFSA